GAFLGRGTEDETTADHVAVAVCFVPLIPKILGDTRCDRVAAGANQQGVETGRRTGRQCRIWAADNEAGDFNRPLRSLRDHRPGLVVFLPDMGRDADAARNFTGNSHDIGAAYRLRGCRRALAETLG